MGTLDLPQEADGPTADRESQDERTTALVPWTRVESIPRVLESVYRSV